MASILGTLFCSLVLASHTCSEGSRLPRGKLFYGEVHVVRTTSQQDAEALSPRVCEEINPANNHRVSLEPILPRSSLWMRLQPPTTWHQPHGRLWARGTQLSHIQVLDPQKLWNNQCLLFEATEFENNLLCNSGKLMQALTVNFLAFSLGFLYEVPV